MPFSLVLIRFHIQLLHCFELTKGNDDTLLNPTKSNGVMCVCGCSRVDAFLRLWGGCFTVRVELSSSGLCLTETTETPEGRRES